jgi:hypothetical protein
VAAAYEAGKAPLDLLLEAQRRRAESAVDYTLNRARYAVATKNVHFVKGTLLDYDGVYLAEGPWPGEAYQDAAKREASRGKPWPLNYASSRAPVVSRGAFPQHVDGPVPLSELPMEPLLEEPLPLETPSIEPPVDENLPKQPDEMIPAPSSASAAPSAPPIGSTAVKQTVHQLDPGESPVGRPPGKGVTSGETKPPSSSIPNLSVPPDSANESAPTGSASASTVLRLPPAN